VDNYVCSFFECSIVCPVDVCQFSSPVVHYLIQYSSDGFSIMSLILTLIGNVLATTYFLAIDLSDDDYKFSLMNETYKTIPNVNASNNKFYFDEHDVEITIPEDRTNCKP